MYNASLRYSPLGDTQNGVTGSTLKRRKTSIDNNNNLSAPEAWELQQTPLPASMSAPSMLPFAAEHTELLETTSESRASKPESKLSRLRTSWRRGTIVVAAAASLSLLINCVVAIWALATLGSSSSLIETYHGSCEKVDVVNKAVHLAINGLSTILLAGSNYCMQACSAPTRDAVDRAHAKGSWMDIGMHSLSNVSALDRKRLAIWMSLFLSSIPLHLMFNSAFYYSLGTNDYWLLVATVEFANGGGWDQKAAWLTPPGPIQQQMQSYETLDRTDCIKAYAQDFVSDRRNVVLIGHNTTQRKDNSLIYVYQYGKLSGFSKTVPGWAEAQFFSLAFWLASATVKR